MKRPADELAAVFARIVGDEHVLSGDRALPYAIDEQVPSLVVAPGDADELSAAMRVAASERLTVFPRGSGTSMSLGNAPNAVDVVLDMSRMQRIVEHQADDLVISVESGVTLDALEKYLAPHGQMLAIDPPGGSDRSIGGIIATNASGALRYRYGTVRELLLGVRFVQADGALTWGGARVIKSVSGYNVPRLLVGSLGTLGVVVEATLRLHAVRRTTATWSIPVDTPESAAAVLAALDEPPVSAERLVLAHGATETSKRWTILVTAATSEGALGERERAILDRTSRHGVTASKMTGAPWPTLRRRLAANVHVKITCEPRKVATSAFGVRQAFVHEGLEPIVMADSGSGTLHAALENDVEAPALHRVVRVLRRALLEEHGAVVVERAPASLKRGLDVWGPASATAMPLIQGLKKTFDPERRLNPGRFVGGL